ncbi:MAG: hypothetical protein E7A81_07755 [Clostridiales bacterium]|nr:hypothetical protein [Clostridiales bacterium]
MVTLKFDNFGKIDDIEVTTDVKPKAGKPKITDLYTDDIINSLNPLTSL